MQPNPKKVKRNEDKDYAEIYQDNFLAKNDPAPLGQAAYNRQLSDGVRKRLGQDNLASSGQTSVGTTSATQRAGYSAFDNAGAAMQRREGALARAELAEAGLGGGGGMPSLDTMGQNFVGSTSATQRAGYSQAQDRRREAELYNNLSATQRAGYNPVDVAGMAMQRRAEEEAEARGRAAQAEARAQQIRLGNPSATQLQGYSPVDTAGRILDERAGLQAQRDAREQQIRLGNPSATALGGYSQAQDRRRDQIQSDIYARQNEIRGGQMARLQEVANLQKQRDARAEQVDLERRLGPSSVSATAGAGYGIAGDVDRNRRAGLQAQREAREQQIKDQVGVFPEYVDPNDYNTSRKYGRDAYDKAVRDAQVRADILNELNKRYGANQADRSEFENTVDRGVQPEYVDPSDYNLSRKAGVDAYNEAVRNAQIQADLANARNAAYQNPTDRSEFENTVDRGVQPEYVDPSDYNLTRKAGVDAYNKALQDAQIQADLINAKNAAYQNPTDRSEFAGSSPVDAPTQAAYDADLERGFLDSESYPTLDEVTNNSATDDGTTNNNTTNEPTTVPRTSSPVSSDISSKESNLYATLDAERDQVLTQFNNNYNQFMQLAINRGAVRGDLESQGFTGGIGQQIRDYLSTGEMQQLNELMMGRDQALKDIELRRNDVPTLALKQSAEELQLAMGSMQLKTQFAMDLATAVTSGLYGLDDAQVFADQYGLQNIQDLIISAAKAEIKAGADAETIKQSLIDSGIDPELVDKKIDEPNTFTAVSNNFLLATDDALALADKGEIDNYDEWADTYIAESGTGRGILDWVVGYLGASLAPVTGGASLQVFNTGSGLDTVGTEDRAVIATDLVQSKFFKDFGEQLQSEGGMQGNISYVRDAATQGAGLGYYNDTYKITIGGTTYDLEGADVTTLVASLTAGNFKVPQALLDLAEEVYNQGLEDGWAKFTDSFGGKYGNAQKLYKSVMKK